MSSLIALALATALLGLSPGPAVFATIGRALTQGLAATYIFITGIIIGDLVFALLAMLGLAALASHYSIIFFLLKIIGGGYLIFLAFKSWQHAKVKKQDTEYTEAGWTLFSSGFLLTASNPKDLLFFIGFLPAFMDLENSNFIDIVLASLVIIITFFFTLSAYALTAHRVRTLFKDDVILTYLNRVSAILLFGVGVLVIAA